MSTVFYSWQSDREHTRQTIKQALLQAIQTLNAETPHQPLSLDEDTANEPGSPEIASAILDKIAACGIFVADVTPISEPTTSRVTPNPNVLIELGYALGTGLGGARVISVVNRDHLPEGKPEGLPFDLRHRRVVLYSSADVESLPDDLAEALRLVNAARERAGLPPGVTDEALRVLDAVAVRATNGQEYPQHLSPHGVGELRAEVGLPQAHLNQILSRLRQEHLVEYDEWSQPFGHCRLAPRGILLTEWLKDRQGVGKAYQALAASVSCRSAAGEFSRIATLAADTGAGSLLVYAILKAWEERDLLHVVEVVGPPSSCLVEGVRPLVGEEARRLPLEVFDTPPPPRPRPSEFPDTSRGSRLSTEDFVAIEDAVRTGMIDLGTAGRW